jgi:transposase
VPGEFGSGSTLHRRFQAWARRGVFKRVWRLLLKEYEELRGIRWRWQALDSATTKAPLGGEAAGKSPVDRGKLGTKRHVLTDQRGAPIGLEVTGANRHDSQAVRATLESIPVRRPTSGTAGEQHLTADKGYDYPSVRRTLKRRGLTAHIPRRDGQPAKQRGKRRYKAKRWVIEHTRLDESLPPSAGAVGEEGGERCGARSLRFRYQPLPAINFGIGSKYAGPSCRGGGEVPPSDAVLIKR